MWRLDKFGFLLGALQVTFLCVFTLFIHYDIEADASSVKHSLLPMYGGFDPQQNSIKDYYPMFQDVHVMVFIGFAFLMTFLRNYGYSAVGMNFLLAAVSIQWALVVQNVWEMEDRKIKLHIKSLVNSEFAAATVLISLGAVLGKTSPLQLLVMALIEVALMTCNERLGHSVLKVNDIGGSIFLHTFGAYFGLAVSFMLKRQDQQENPKEQSTYHSDIFSMIGTLFLWVFWPSFNAVLTEGDAKHRTVINTYLSLTSSCIATFALSAALDKRNKLSMVHIQNATLAGGVAIGTTADLMTEPYGAMAIGTAGGIVSVLGYRYLTPLMYRKWNIHDTCGVNNLHGMPGILAALVGAILVAIASEKNYSKSLYWKFPARAPPTNSTELSNIVSHYHEVKGGENRTALEQMGYQMAALPLTLVVAIVGGILTGRILQYSALEPRDVEHYFDDNVIWHLPGEEGDRKSEDTSLQNVATV